MSIRVRSVGPVFDGRAERALQRGSDDAERDIALYAEKIIKDRLDQVLKHPTGFYRSQVKAEPSGARWRVHDSRVVYGPWLETGKNRRRTRFRGYRTFRWASRRVRSRAPARARRILLPYVRRIQ